ncbi:low molecular weight phosphotyrosine protein phosphatase [Porticoccaceae bacterium]|nr:low molecular weight phosphotyrosine protein phosphatase [Porticoccaceae bacterium]
MNKVSVLFVCLGNICRSPTAHAVFRSMVESRGLSGQILVDSAGTGDWHLGHAPDRRTSAQAAERGYDMSDLRARLVEPKDFEQFDYIIGMDHENISNLMLIRPADYTGHVELFLSFSQKPENRDQTVVPDPYYGGENGFALVLDLVEDAAAGLLNHIVAELERGSQ